MSRIEPIASGPLSRREAGCRSCELDDGERCVLPQFGKNNPELISTRRLVQQFLRIVPTRGRWNLEARVVNVDLGGPSELRRFRRNLRTDWDAVRAGLTK